MKSRYLHRNSLLVVILLALVLLTSTGFTAAQARSSSGPLLLRQVRRIYVAPSFDDFALMIKARLETWAAVEIVSDSEDADAILTC